MLTRRHLDFGQRLAARKNGMGSRAPTSRRYGKGRYCEPVPKNLCGPIRPLGIPQKKASAVRWLLCATIRGAGPSIPNDGGFEGDVCQRTHKPSLLRRTAQVACEDLESLLHAHLRKASYHDAECLRWKASMSAEMTKFDGFRNKLTEKSCSWRDLHVVSDLQILDEVEPSLQRLDAERFEKLAPARCSVEKTRGPSLDNVIRAELSGFSPCLQVVFLA